MTDDGRSRYWPKCDCADRQAAVLEMRMWEISTATIWYMSQQAHAANVCLDGQRYLMMTMVTSIVAGLCTEEITIREVLEGKMPKINEAKFEDILATLVADVRHRRSEMEAIAEQRRETQQ